MIQQIWSSVIFKEKETKDAHIACFSKSKPLQNFISPLPFSKTINFMFSYGVHTYESEHFFQENILTFITLSFFDYFLITAQFLKWTLAERYVTMNTWRLESLVLTE